MGLARKHEAWYPVPRRSHEERMARRVTRFRQWLAEANQKNIDFLVKKHSDITTDHDMAAKTIIDLQNKNRKDANQPELLPHEHIIRTLANTFDPDHENHSHTDTLAKWYKQKDFRMEDYPSVKRTLLNFHDWKHKLPSQKIGSYKSLGDLKGHLEKVMPHEGPDPSKPFSHPEAKQIYKDDQITVNHIQTHDAARALNLHFARKSDEGPWCIGWNSPKNFNHYNQQSELVHVQDHKNNTHYLLHASSNQFKDTRDVEVKDRTKTIDSMPGLRNVKALNHHEYGMWSIPFMHEKDRQQHLNDMVDPVKTPYDSIRHANMREAAKIPGPHIQKIAHEWLHSQTDDRRRAGYMIPFHHNDIQDALINSGDESVYHQLHHGHGGKSVDDLIVQHTKSPELKESIRKRWKDYPDDSKNIWMRDLDHEHNVKHLSGYAGSQSHLSDLVDNFGTHVALHRHGSYQGLDRKANYSGDKLIERQAEYKQHFPQMKAEHLRSLLQFKRSVGPTGHDELKQLAKESGVPEWHPK